ncbi:MAG TPA: aminotransferase class I/II-fold pyridoxal phosphate-dependent enzyme [Candidatus Obscuribacterales bacterium]
MVLPKSAVMALNSYETPEEDRGRFIRLDFNENTCGFPDLLTSRSCDNANIYPEYGRVIAQFASAFGIDRHQLILTNGSDEALSLIAQTFIEPGQDAALISKSTFCMIKQTLLLSGSKVAEIPVTNDLHFDLDAIDDALKRIQPKIAAFASPDNPTGAILPFAILRYWLNTFGNTLFVIDEAYAEYSGQSAIDLVRDVDNLLIVKTLSKAWGLAGLRLGLIIGNASLLTSISTVRMPYSVNSAALAAATALLPEKERVLCAARETMRRKKTVVDEIRALGFQINEGKGNFYLLNAGSQAECLTSYLREQGILVRNRSQRASSDDSPLWGMIRITVGTAEENEQLISAIRRFLDSTTSNPAAWTPSFAANGTASSTPSVAANGTASSTSFVAAELTPARSSVAAPAVSTSVSSVPVIISNKRVGRYVRKSKETQVDIEIALDNQGVRNIKTPLPFLSHMLDAFLCHGSFAAEICANGDIEVDPHHLIEDTGIVLGKSIKDGLRAFTGIRRAASFTFPMDGSLASVSLDLCGRANLVWNVKFGFHPVGGLDPNLFREFFKGVADGLGATIHVNVPYADNDHHVTEAIFKAFGRSLNEATRPLSERNDRLSTKGMFDEQ